MSSIELPCINVKIPQNNLETDVCQDSQKTSSDATAKV